MMSSYMTAQGELFSELAEVIDHLKSSRIQFDQLRNSGACGQQHKSGFTTPQ
jgi:hypothetical protein